jgi:hypothetical protein
MSNEDEIRKQDPHSNVSSTVNNFWFVCCPLTKRRIQNLYFTDPFKALAYLNSNSRRCTTKVNTNILPIFIHNIMRILSRGNVVQSKCVISTR